MQKWLALFIARGTEAFWTVCVDDRVGFRVSLTVSSRAVDIGR